jgi:hypothetical protein
MWPVPVSVWLLGNPGMRPTKGLLYEIVQVVVTTASVAEVAPVAQIEGATVMPVRFGAAAWVRAVTVPHVEGEALLHTAASLEPSRAAWVSVS